MSRENDLDLPFFDAEHRGFAAGFGSWVASNLTEFESDEGGDGRAARSVFQALGAANWLNRSVALSSSPAGGRIDLRWVCLLREALGYSSAIADVAFSEPWLAALPLALYGSSDQKNLYLDPYRIGRCLPAFALSEPDAGSDVAAIKTVAVHSGNGFLLSGTKTWTSNSGLADVYLIFARTDEKSISAFLVNGANPGVSLTQRIRVLSPHTVGTLRFENCHVDASAIVGEMGQGFEIAMAALELFRPTVAAATLGFARRALDEAIRRSQERSTFGKQLSEHQMIQSALADMVVKVSAASLLVYRAAWAHDTGAQSIAQEASVAKLYASEAAQQVVDQALQIFGGMGVVEGTVVERLYRHVRAFRIFDGTSEIQKLIIAKRLLKG